MNQDNRTFAELRRDLDALSQLLYGQRATLRKRPVGRYNDGVTVYEVKRHRVKAHWRRGGKRVRINQ